MNRNTFVLATLGAVALMAITACGDDDGSDATTTSVSSSGNGGSSSGNGGAGGGTGGSSGGVGGGGVGGGGVGGGGGAGGGGVECLPASTYDDIFSVVDADLCVVATYEADVFVGTDATFYAAAPTWGAHGGPLLVRSGPTGSEDNLQFTRLTSDGMMLTAQTQEVDLTIPAGFFLGSQAIDVPGTDWTLVSWTGLDTAGEVVAISNGMQADSFGIVGFFSGAMVGSGDTARLISTGLTPLGDNNTANGNSALYGADFCTGPSLCANGTVEIDSWGSASGAAAHDQDDNAFIILTDPSFLGGDNTQTLRGFGAADVAHGSGMATGTELFNIDGYGYAIAARSPATNVPGIVMYQPFDSTTFSAKDVVAVRYNINGGDVVAAGEAEAALTMTNAGAEVVLVSDDQGRIWVGHGVSEQPASSRWFVLDIVPR